MLNAKIAGYCWQVLEPGKYDSRRAIRWGVTIKATGRVVAGSEIDR